LLSEIEPAAVRGAAPVLCRPDSIVSLPLSSTISLIDTLVVKLSE
jgi:hypothetical protein